MGACAIKGREYSAEIWRPETLAGSPAEYKFTPFFVAACFSDAITPAVLRSLFAPSSQLTYNVRRPSMAVQTLSATTATAEPPIFPTQPTPEIVFDSLSSKPEI